MTKLILILSLILTLHAIRIHKLDQIYSNAGITHYTNLKYHDATHDEHKLSDASKEHDQGWNPNNNNGNRNGNASFSAQKPSSTKVNFSYSNKPVNNFPTNSGAPNLGNNTMNRPSNFPQTNSGVFPGSSGNNTVNRPSNFPPTNSGFYPNTGSSSGNNSFPESNNNVNKPSGGSKVWIPSNAGSVQPGTNSFGGPTNSGFIPSNSTSGSLNGQTFGVTSGSSYGPGYGTTRPIGGNFTNVSKGPSSNNQWGNSTWSGPR